MAFDKEILRRIHTDFTTRRIANETRAEDRKAQIYEAIPRIRDIDEQLRYTPVEIVRAAFAKREDPIPKLEKVKEKNLKLQAERRECLVSHGYSWDYLDVHYDCEKCNDTGYLKPGVPCECLVNAYKTEQVKKISEDFGFEVKPLDSINYDYYSKEKIGNITSAYDNTKMLVDICRCYVKDFENKKRNLFITGISGIGKTYIASCVALEVANRGFSVAYGTAFDILGAMEDKKFNRESSEDKTDDYKKADLLIIDDLGAEMITAYSTAALYNLISMRQTAAKATILISTFSVSEIKNKYTPQIASRIEGDYTELSLVGQDIRKKLGE